LKSVENKRTGTAVFQMLSTCHELRKGCASVYDQAADVSGQVCSFD
jgi:hypothetical protein